MKKKSFSSLAGMIISITSLRWQMQEHSHSDHEGAHVCSWTPLNRTDFLIESPPLHLAADDNLPKAYDPLLVRTHDPCAIWTDRNTTHSSAYMRKTEGFVIRERP